nr:MAG TPA: hypothetical protein [Caudoviricetes sp.]
MISEIFIISVFCEIFVVIFFKLNYKFFKKLRINFFRSYFFQNFFLK